MTELKFTDEERLKIYEAYLKYPDGMCGPLDNVITEAERIVNARVRKPVFELGKKYRCRDGAIVTVVAIGKDVIQYVDAIGRSFLVGAKGNYSSNQPPEQYNGDLIPGAIEEPPPVAEIPADNCLGGAAEECSAEMANEELGRELSRIHHEEGARDHGKINQIYAAMGRKARELLAPQIDYVAMNQLSVERFEHEQTLARAEKADARIEKFRATAETALGMHSQGEQAEGYNLALRAALEHFGFTIIPAVPAQPLKVVVK